jgi:hypothetical protein
MGNRQQGANNGAILLVAPNDRRVRIEAGYGLEGILTDALSAQIINGLILPRFRDNDIPGGIMAGADALIQQLQAPPEAAEQRALEAAQAEQGSKGGGGSIFPLVFWLVVLILRLHTPAAPRAQGPEISRPRPAARRADRPVGSGPRRVGRRFLVSGWGGWSGQRRRELGWWRRLFRRRRIVRWRRRFGGMVMRHLSPQDEEIVTAAVAKAEQDSDGEIVTIVASRSDAYHDVALHYAVLAMLIVPAKLALLPKAWIDRAATLLLGWNGEFDRRR